MGKRVGLATKKNEGAKSTKKNEIEKRRKKNPYTFYRKKKITYTQSSVHSIEGKGKKNIMKRTGAL